MQPTRSDTAGRPAGVFLKGPIVGPAFTRGAVVRVLAAKFVDRDTAVRVLEQLRAAYDLGPADADVAPFHETDEADPDATTLLAGRFHDARANAIRETMRGAGGTVVADVDEDRTQPRPLVRPMADAPRGENQHVPSDLQFRTRVVQSH